MEHCPKKSGIFISNQSKGVSVHPENVKSLAEKIYKDLRNGKFSIAAYSQHECHPKNVSDEKAVDWIFVIDTLNFCFWTPGAKKKWEVTWKGRTYTGYFALCAAISRAIEAGVPLTDPKAYVYLKTKEVEDIFCGDDSTVEIPLLKERVRCLKEVGNILLQKYDGSFVNCVRSSKQSSQKLLNIITNEFPCFRDEAEYCGQKVAFYKRAQILIGDLWSFFKGEGLGQFNDIQAITMFADYRVPQVLVHFGILKYSDTLMKKLKSDEILENGCKEEIEIRGCSIEAVELIKEAVSEMIEESGQPLLCNSILIDQFLWQYRRAEAVALAYIPFHKVISIYY